MFFFVPFVPFIPLVPRLLLTFGKVSLLVIFLRGNPWISGYFVKPKSFKIGHFVAKNYQLTAGPCDFISIRKKPSVNSAFLIVIGCLWLNLCVWLFLHKFHSLPLSLYICDWPSIDSNPPRSAWERVFLQRLSWGAVKGKNELLRIIHLFSKSGWSGDYRVKSNCWWLKSGENPPGMVLKPYK